MGVTNMDACCKVSSLSSSSSSLQGRLPFPTTTIPRAGSIKETQKVFTKQAHKLVKQADKHEQFLSKVTYCLEVLLFGLFCYMLGSSPQDIPRLYCSFFMFAVPLRWIYYRSKKWHYYLLDFCYYANVIFVSMLLYFPNNSKLFMLCFSFSEGPLAWALIVWRCSLVFSSIDKTISVLIHLLPGTVFFILRWWDEYTWSTEAVEENGPFLAWPVVNSIPTLWMWLFFVPLMVYCIWQGLYFLVVEGLRRQRMSQDPELMTSYRELKRKAERANNIWWRLSGLLGADNRVYMYAILQAAFTVATLALTVPMFKSYRLHTAFEVFKLAATVWNGGNFVFEVMPRQVAKKLSKTEKTTIMLEDAPTCMAMASQVHACSRKDDVHALNAARSAKVGASEGTKSEEQEVVCALCKRPSQEDLPDSSLSCGDTPCADEDVKACRLLKWMLEKQPEMQGRRGLGRGSATTRFRDGAAEWLGSWQVACAG